MMAWLAQARLQHLTVAAADDPQRSRQAAIQLLCQLMQLVAADIAADRFGGNGGSVLAARSAVLELVDRLVAAMVKLLAIAHRHDGMQPPTLRHPLHQ
jgi:hypothetical protein